MHSGSLIYAMHILLEIWTFLLIHISSQPMLLTFIFSIYFKDHNYIVTLLDNGLKLEANGDYY